MRRTRRQRTEQRPARNFQHLWGSENNVRMWCSKNPRDELPWRELSPQSKLPGEKWRQRDSFPQTYNCGLQGVREAWTGPLALHFLTISPFSDQTQWGKPSWRKGKEQCPAGVGLVVVQVVLDGALRMIHQQTKVQQWCYLPLFPIFCIPTLLLLPIPRQKKCVHGSEQCPKLP